MVDWWSYHTPFIEQERPCWEGGLHSEEMAWYMGLPERWIQHCQLYILVIIRLIRCFCPPQLNRDVGTVRRKKPSAESPALKLPSLVAPEQDTSNPFPILTSREVGWRSRREHSLEFYGRHGRPKYSIVKQLRWPNDAVPWKPLATCTCITNKIILFVHIWTMHLYWAILCSCYSVM